MITVFLASGDPIGFETDVAYVDAQGCLIVVRPDKGTPFAAFGPGIWAMFLPGADDDDGESETLN